MASILIVEDEQNIARFLTLELQHEGFDIEVCADGREALNAFQTRMFDLVLIDIMIPGINGLELTRRIRKTSHTPILLVTARDAVMDRVAGLEAGADDYIVKPFAIEELLARIRVALRRSNTNQLNSLNDFVINEQSRQVNVEGIEIELTKTEFDLLVYLSKHQNVVLSRQQIVEHVWGFDAQAETNVVDVYIRHLRKKLPPVIAKRIGTVRGIGYMMHDEN